MENGASRSGRTPAARLKAALEIVSNFSLSLPSRSVYGYTELYNLVLSDNSVISPQDFLPVVPRFLETLKRDISDGASPEESTEAMRWVSMLLCDPSITSEVPMEDVIGLVGSMVVRHKNTKAWQRACSIALFAIRVNSVDPLAPQAQCLADCLTAGLTSTFPLMRRCAAIAAQSLLTRIPRELIHAISETASAAGPARWDIALLLCCVDDAESVRVEAMTAVHRGLQALLSSESTRRWVLDYAHSGNLEKKVTELSQSGQYKCAARSWGCFMALSPPEIINTENRGALKTLLEQISWYIKNGDEPVRLAAVDSVKGFVCNASVGGEEERVAKTLSGVIRLCSVHRSEESPVVRSSQVAVLRTLLASVPLKYFLVKGTEKEIWPYLYKMANTSQPLDKRTAAARILSELVQYTSSTKNSVAVNSSGKRPLDSSNSSMSVVARPSKAPKHSDPFGCGLGHNALQPAIEPALVVPSLQSAHVPLESVRENVVSVLKELEAGGVAASSMSNKLDSESPIDSELRAYVVEIKRSLSMWPSSSGSQKARQR